MTMQTQTAAGLSPAQKAWVTRRARLALLDTMVAATAPTPPGPRPYVEPEWMKARPVAAPRDAMEPVTEFYFVDLWVDDPAVGCGHRRFVVLDKGAHRVRLFCASPLAAIVIDRAVFDSYHRPALKVRRQALADIIRRNVAMADRINDAAERDAVSDGGVFAVRALQLVTGEGRQ